jgi:hypothetical protein
MMLLLPIAIGIFVAALWVFILWVRKRLTEDGSGPNVTDNPYLHLARTKLLGDPRRLRPKKRTTSVKTPSNKTTSFESQPDTTPSDKTPSDKKPSVASASKTSEKK